MMKAVLKRRCADHLHHPHLQDYPPQDHLLHHLLRLAQGTALALMKMTPCS